MKYLITGLGNIGYEYEGTRHNIGFEAVDFLCKNLEGSWRAPIDDKASCAMEFHRHALRAVDHHVVNRVIHRDAESDGIP